MNFGTYEEQKHKTNRKTQKVLGLEHAKKTNPKSQTHTHKERETNIHEVRQEAYVSRAEENEIY